MIFRKRPVWQAKSCMTNGQAGQGPYGITGQGLRGRLAFKACIAGQNLQGMQGTGLAVKCSKGQDIKCQTGTAGPSRACKAKQRLQGQGLQVCCFGTPFWKYNNLKKKIGFNLI